MIQSMTGYGKSVLQLPTKKISIELKSLNSKNLDLNARMPSMYREKELAIRSLIATKLVRGKIDFSLYVEITGEETSSTVNQPVVKKYMEQLSQIGRFCILTIPIIISIRNGKTARRSSGSHQSMKKGVLEERATA